MILGIETSCDETAAALVDRDGRLVSNVVSSQAELHGRYGGVVPEVASRRHLELTVPVVERALELAGVGYGDLEAVAATRGPGLIGALLVGLATAKSIAFGRSLPFIPVDHLLGHVAALYLEPDPLDPPFLLLLASGGHTILADVVDRTGMRVLGSTLDDAAGEAFDKGARLLGLGYPGGAQLERLATGGDPEAVPFPTAMRGRPGHDLSFSGLKTALRVVLESAPDSDRADVAASYQAAIVRSLSERAMEAVAASGRDTLAVVGGVARNRALRSDLERRCDAAGVRLVCAPIELCSDNAAMIASAARFLPRLSPAEYLGLDAYASFAGAA